MNMKSLTPILSTKEPTTISRRPQRKVLQTDGLQTQTQSKAHKAIHKVIRKAHKEAAQATTKLEPKKVLLGMMKTMNHLFLSYKKMIATD